MRLLIVTLVFLVGCGKSSKQDESVEAQGALVSCTYTQSQIVEHCGAFAGCQDIEENEYLCVVESEQDSFTCAVTENAESETIISDKCAKFGFTPIKWPEHKPQ